MPIEPVSIAAASDRMSPKMLPVTITSNSRGLRISCIAAASTYMCAARHRDSRAPTSVTTSRQSVHGLQHIGLVDRAELLAALARRLEAGMRDALDLGLACSAWC